MAEVTFDKVEKVYDNDVHAVHDLSLEIRDGEFVVLVGPSGCDGPRDRATATGLPDGRAALEPRREAARADARRDRTDPARGRSDDGLRHARPGRGDDDGGSGRGHA